MRYVQLRAFHYVAICGGFSRAAEALFLTQPAISDQVRKLEEEYDILLFNRHKKQVTLTAPGERLLEITRRMFDT
jgi:DNA-binding transcriptional LysR family regulator